MPRGQVTKNEMKVIVLSYMHQLQYENPGWESNPKELTKKYLNKLLDKLEEYAR